ncbi:probable inactive beta-glucosidase 14 [Actinidia eriantha]|uniref:probable inactive beta-glucosidase 14 n=1 Tax=Actinidia eriantha TaxID=165200 RepID=UPI002590FEE3|nr:probable inactive beta-glucosidase 14 [Actinidia eriantha]
MEEIIDYLKKRYQNKPMFVLENGYAPPAQPNVQVKDLLHDVKRIDFHKAYLSSLARAIRDGADVRGYFIWTLMDDFEWIHGYDTTFGLYYVDPQTLKRIPKPGPAGPGPAHGLAGPSPDQVQDSMGWA